MASVQLSGSGEYRARGVHSESGTISVCTPRDVAATQLAGSNAEFDSKITLRRESLKTQAILDGGESGIRTHGRVSPTHAFQACSFNHSDISPCL
jgi:hypothetical protein